MLNQVIIIDDKFDHVQYYKSLLNIQNVEVCEMVIDTALGSFMPDVTASIVRRAYIVDLNLNSKKTEERSGLEVIHRIRLNQPDILVIAYSGRSLRKEAMDAGANYFFLKQPGYEKEDFKVMNLIITEYFNHQASALPMEYLSKESEQIKAGDISKAQNTRHAEHIKDKIKSLEEQYDNNKAIKTSKQRLIKSLYQQMEIISPDDIEILSITEKNIAVKEDELKKIDEKLDEIISEMRRLEQANKSLL